MTGRNAFVTCVNDFGPVGEVSEEGLAALSEVYQEMEEWLPKLEQRMSTIATFGNPRSNIELGLFDWAKSALSAQFVWAEISYNALILWIRSCAGMESREEAFAFYQQYIMPNHEETQRLPRTLDFIQTKKEWPPKGWIDKQSALSDFARAKRISGILQLKFK